MPRSTCRRLALLPWLAALALAASSCAPPPAGRTDVVVTHPDATPIAPYDTCTVTTAREASYGSEHVPACSELALASFPPTSGAHYASWADFGVYDAPVPWGFLVHSMEHGAVVIAYRCDGDCAALEAELADVVASRPADPRCRDDDPTRLILAPAPDLEEPIAVLAWERLYLATCFDRPSLEAFVDEVYARAPEDTCAPGVVPGTAGFCP